MIWTVWIIVSLWKAAGPHRKKHSMWPFIALVGQVASNENPLFPADFAFIVEVVTLLFHYELQLWSTIMECLLATKMCLYVRIEYSGNPWEILSVNVSLWVYDSDCFKINASWPILNILEKKNQIKLNGYKYCFMCHSNNWSWKEP